MSKRYKYIHTGSLTCGKAAKIGMLFKCQDVVKVVYLCLYELTDIVLVGNLIHENSVH